ncbi:MAG: amylosucrase, partial [Lachnospiraceae bacterium]|nr:amylosucrase [Lachnospiraceae bacterium]
MKKSETLYEKRFDRHFDELKWLYTELYNNDAMFKELCEQMKVFYDERRDSLKVLDHVREIEPDWYKKNDMLGMMFYID